MEATTHPHAARSDAIGFFEVLRTRRSVRSYLDWDVAELDLAAIFSAMGDAPSAGDLKSYEVVVVRDPQRRLALARAAYQQRFVAQAPLVLVFFMNPARSSVVYGRRGELLYGCQDATIAAAYAQLAAHARGLGTVWVGAFDDEAICQAVDAPDFLRPSSMLVVGQPTPQEAEPASRRLSWPVRHWESFDPRRVTLPTPTPASE